MHFLVKMKNRLNCADLYVMDDNNRPIVYRNVDQNYFSLIEAFRSCLRIDGLCHISKVIPWSERNIKQLKIDNFSGLF
jgi:hypothetical protein